MADSDTGKPEMPEPVRRLVDALWGRAEGEISHDECRAVLPQFVEAEVAGEDAAGRYPRVQRHLDHCQECGEEYAMLVDLELAEQAGELKLTPQETLPAFSYQQARMRGLETIIVEWTRALLAILAPANLGDLDRAADTFFASLKPRQANEARATYAEAARIGRGASDPALEALAASYVTTQDLITQVSRAQFDAWAAQGILGAELETRAHATARGIGLAETTARDFASAFARVVEREPGALRDLLAR